MFAVGFALAFISIEEDPEIFEKGAVEAILETAMIIVVDVAYDDFVGQPHDDAQIVFDGFEEFCWGFLEGALGAGLSQGSALGEVIVSTLQDIYRAGLNYAYACAEAKTLKEKEEAKKDFLVEFGVAVAQGVFDYLVSRLLAVKSKGNINLVMSPWAKKNLGLKTQRIPKEWWTYRLVNALSKVGEYLLDSIEKLGTQEHEKGEPIFAPTGIDAMGPAMG
jgi:hypothetical protein